MLCPFREKTDSKNVRTTSSHLLVAALMNKLHVGHLIAAVEIGGAEEIVRSIAKRLGTSKHFHVTVIPFVRASNAQNDFVLRLKKDGVDVAVIEMVRYKLRYWNVFMNLLRLCKVIRAQKIAILHTHGYRSNIIGLLAARIVGIPAVSTCHGWIENGRALRLYNSLDRTYRELEKIDFKGKCYRKDRY